MEDDDGSLNIFENNPLLQNSPLLHIDPRSLLEVADYKHRYGKNLRAYFRVYCEEQHWILPPSSVPAATPTEDVPSSSFSLLSAINNPQQEQREQNQISPRPLVSLSLPKTTTVHYLTFEEKIASYQPFFHWLDNPEKRPAELPDCPFSILDNDIVQYLTAEEDRVLYKYWINEEGLIEHYQSKILLSTDPKGTTFHCSLFYFPFMYSHCSLLFLCTATALLW
jgi:hypothetical protein